MAVTRRDFLQTSLATGALLALGTAPSTMAQTADKPAAVGKKRILILGGTGFLGPAIVEAAKARGHSLTLFNRGKTEKRIGTIDGVEKLRGNRDPNLPADDTKNDKGEFVNPSDKGLEQLKGKTWDAVIDDCGYYPRIVKASAELLAPSVKQYIFISSVSVYSDDSTPDTDESAPLATVTDPTVETMGDQYQNYGGFKVMCEQAAEAALPGRVANVRPGLIVGPGDLTDRFTYWPVRISRGGEVMAPGTPNDPIQMIDVRDLAAWLIMLVENGTTGVFTANGPAPGKLTIGQALDACKKAAKSNAEFTWVSADFLAEQHVSPWGDMPLWLPPSGESAGAHRRNNARAVAAGLKFRPVEETAAGILAWWPKEIERRKRVGEQLREEARTAGQPEPKLPDPNQLKAGIKADGEAEVLKAWHTKIGD